VKQVTGALHWLCALGWHRWRAYLSEDVGKRTLYSECRRPNCLAIRTTIFREKDAYGRPVPREAVNLLDAPAPPGEGA